MKSWSLVAICLACLICCCHIIGGETPSLESIFGTQPKEVLDRSKTLGINARVFRDEIKGQYHLVAGVLKGDSIQISSNTRVLVKGVLTPDFVPSKDKWYFVGTVSPRGAAVYEIFIQVDDGPLKDVCVNMRGSQPGKKLAYDIFETSLNLYELGEIPELSEGPVSFHCTRIFVH